MQKPFEQFVKNNAQKIDIFCFQEVLHNYQGNYNNVFTVENTNFNLFNDLSTKLSNHIGYFCPVFEGIYGIATFIKKDFEITDQGSIVIYENTNFPDAQNENADHTRKILWIKIKRDSKEYLIINVHGHWVPDDKSDNEARINQSQTILNLISGQKIPIILCGDFNLRPDTKSVEIIERKLVNLIKKYKVQSTRTSLYTKPEKFADYIFVSPDIKVKNFKTLPDEVSDHKPLFLDFE